MLFVRCWVLWIVILGMNVERAVVELQMDGGAGDTIDVRSSLAGAGGGEVGVGGGCEGGVVAIVGVDGRLGFWMTGWCRIFCQC